VGADGAGVARPQPEKQRIQGKIDLDPHSETSPEIDNALRLQMS